LHRPGTEADKEHRRQHQQRQAQDPLGRHGEILPGRLHCRLV